MADALGKRHDATGRSTGEIVHYAGRAKRWKFEEAFVGEPISLLESPGYQALNFPAFKILAFLKLEHVRHGGAENGRLLAPHRQLQALGISPRHIKPALAMLEAFGVIRCTTDGMRLGGRPNAATYALTWLPTSDGQLPTEDYRKVTKGHVGIYLIDRYADRKTAPKKTAQAHPKEGGTPTLRKAETAKSGGNAYPKEGGTAYPKEGTIYILGGSPSVGGSAGRGAEPSNSAALSPATHASPSSKGLPEKIGLVNVDKTAANDGPYPTQSNMKDGRP